MAKYINLQLDQVGKKSRGGKKMIDGLFSVDGGDSESVMFQRVMGEAATVTCVL